MNHIVLADMDGFRLLETIALELDVPVISEFQNPSARSQPLQETHPSSDGLQPVPMFPASCTDSALICCSDVLQW